MQKCFLCYVNDGFASLGFTYPKQKQEYLHFRGIQNASVIQKVKKKQTKTQKNKPRALCAIS